MSATLDIEVTDLANFPRFITDKVAKNIKFGITLGLNKMSQSIVAIEKQRMESVFTLRNPWVKKGITFTPSHKNQTTPVVIIGHRDDYMVLQETGGIKRPTEGGKPIAVPAAIRKSSTQKITKRNRPRALLANTSAKKRAFIVTFKSGKSAIVRRKTKRRLPLDVLYLLPTKTRVGKRLGFEDSVEGNVKSGLQFFIDTGLDVAFDRIKQFPPVPGTF